MSCCNKTCTQFSDKVLRADQAARRSRLAALPLLSSGKKSISRLVAVQNTQFLGVVMYSWCQGSSGLHRQPRSDLIPHGFEKCSEKQPQQLAIVDDVHVGIPVRMCPHGILALDDKIAKFLERDVIAAVFV